MEPNGYIVKEQCLLAVFHQMPLDCMICTAMYGSGVKIGMVRIIILQAPHRIHRDLHQVSIVCFAAGLGASAQGTAVQLLGTGILPTIAASASDFVFSRTYNPLFSTRIAPFPGRSKAVFALLDNITRCDRCHSSEIYCSPTRKTTYRHYRKSGVTVVILQPAA